MTPIPDFDSAYLRQLHDDAVKKKNNTKYRKIDPEECEISYMRAMHRGQHALQSGLSSVYTRITYKMKEQPRLRKNSKNYFILYRRDGKLVQTELYSDGERYFDFYQMHYEGNKRYGIPFCSYDGVTLSESYGDIYVTKTEDGFVTEEYLIDGGTIVYERYKKVDDNRVDYYFIKYHTASDENSETKGLHDIYEGFITLDGERPEFHKTGGWSWYDDYYKYKYDLK